MIYCDNSATTLVKPKEVAEGVMYAINNFGNSGRSFYDAVLDANRAVFATRYEIAELVGISDPLNVAFTSSATESLNLVISSLIKSNHNVISTITEHNSVLRPLYLTGCNIDFVNCDNDGVISYSHFESIIKPSTNFFVCTHGSNVTGNITDVKKFYSLCKKHGIIMILDISQTFGSEPVDTDMADVFCFTGHKALFGPQGTGGIIVNNKLNFNIVKTGGSGIHSFDKFQPKEMPDVFEAGTINTHGIYGLQKGVQFIKKTGMKNIKHKEQRLTNLFYDGIKNIDGITIYGDFLSKERLPVVSITMDGLNSAELSTILWQRYKIATRAGSHCAPLLHKHFNTVDTGLTRFSFSYFNTEEEVQECITALQDIREIKKNG